MVTDTPATAQIYRRILPIGHGYPSITPIPAIREMRWDNSPPTTCPICYERPATVSASVDEIPLCAKCFTVRDYYALHLALLRLKERGQAQ